MSYFRVIQGNFDSCNIFIAREIFPCITLKAIQYYINIIIILLPSH